MLEWAWAVAARASLVDWLLLAGALLAAFYVAGTWTYDFFSARGLPSKRPLFPFLGSTATAFLNLQGFHELVMNLYNSGRGHSVYGFFEFRRPIFMVRDPELLKVVAVKEFDHFMNHRPVVNEKADPIFAKNLFSLKDQRWRAMRATLSPAFTTSKIKSMFPLITQCSQQMAQHLQRHYEKSPEGARRAPLETNMKDVFSRMANDVIASVAFGVSCDSLASPNNEFYRNGKDITTFSGWRSLIFVGYLLVPKLMAMLKLSVLSPKAASFFDGIVHETVRERQLKSIFRPDMLQLLMQAREGQLKAEKGDEHETDSAAAGEHKLSDEDITAQAVIFFFAGFETVSTALCFAAVSLSREPHVQRRLQEEVDGVMARGALTYEAVQGMKYLDMVINETLRRYPPVVAVDRECLEATTLPATDTTGPASVRKGDIVWVPVYALHHDPDHWPEPERFDPERFSDENKANIKPYTYMPFGIGPRICIGQRFALLEVKLALVSLLARFDLKPSARTLYPIQFEKGFNVMAKGGLWCELVPRAHHTPAA